MEGGIKTLDEFISKLKQIEDMSPGDAMKKIGTRGGTQFMTLLQQADQVLELRDKIKQASAEDTTGEMADQMTNNVAGAIKMMESAWEGFILSFSESTGPWKDVIDLITKGITETTNLIATGSTIDKEALYAVMTGLGSLITMYGVKNGVMAVTQRLTAAQTAQYLQMAAALEAANSAEAVGYATELKSAVSKGILTEAQAARITSLILENDAIVAKKKTEISLFQTEAEAIAQEIAFAEAEYAAASGAEKEMWALWKKDAVMKQGAITQKIAVAQTQADAAVNAKDAAMKMLNQKSTLSLKAAMDALGLSMLANPYILAAAAIAGVAYVLYKVRDAAFDAEKAQDLLNSAIDEHNQKLQEEETAERNAIKTIQDKNASLYDQYKAYKELTKARGVFAQYTQEELKNMSQEQIDALFSLDNSQRQREMNENRVKAYMDFMREFSQAGGSGRAWNRTGEEDVLTRLQEKYKLGTELTDAWKDTDDWVSLDEYMVNMYNQASNRLNEDLRDNAFAGLTQGFEKASEEVQGQVSAFVGDFNKSIEGVDDKKVLNKISENFKSEVQPSLDAAIQKSKDLNKELVSATGEKETKIKAELDKTNADIEVLRALLDFFRLGNEKEVVVKIQQDVENAEVGDDFLMDLGKGYEDAEKYVNEYLAHIEQAKDKIQQMGDVSVEEAQKIKEEFGLTQKDLDEGIGALGDKVQAELDDLNAEYKEAKTDIEKNKLQVQISKKQELLDYINSVKTELRTVVNNTWTARIDLLVGKISPILKRLLGVDVQQGLNYQVGGNARVNTAREKAEKAKMDAEEAAARAAAKKKEEEDAKKDASEKASKEAAQRRKQQKEYETLMDKQKRERERAAKDMEFSTRQAEIKAMEEGSEKTLAQIQLDFEKQEEAIQRGYEDLKLKKIEQARQLFEKNPANKGKEFDVSSVDTSYTEAEQANRDAQRIENEVKKKKAIEDVNKAELQAMNDYLKEYGSMEQKRLAIAQEYAQKIKDAKTEGERLSLQKELQEKQGALSFENIAMDIDWGAVFGGIENMTTEMMQRLYNQLKAFERTDEYRKADAGTKQQVADMIAQFRQFVGNTDQSDNIAKMGDAVQKFNEAVLKYKEATENDKIAREEYEKATSEYNIALANKESYDKKLESGEITQEIYDELAPTAEELNELGERAKQSSENFSETGAKAAQAKENVQSLGIAAREAADDVRGWVSKGVQNAKNSFFGKNDVMGFSNLAQAFESFDNFKGALDAGMNEGKLTGAMNSAANVISNDIIPVVDSVGDGIMGAFSEGFLGAMTMYAKVAQMILQMSDQVKEYVTGILDSFTELFKFEWLEDLVVSITSSISNLVDAIFDLPENLYKALEGLVTNGIGSMVGNVFGRVGNVLSFGGLSTDWLNDSLFGSDSDFEAATEKWGWLLDSWKENIDYEKSLIEKAYGKDALDIQEKTVKQLEDTQKAARELYSAWAGSGSGLFSHSHGYNANRDAVWQYLWNYNSDFGKKAGMGNQGDRGDIVELIENLSADELKQIKNENLQFWSTLDDTAKEYIKTIIEAEDEINNVNEAAIKQLTDLDLSTLESQFTDMLDNWDEESANFADDFEGYMKKAIMKSLMTKTYSKELEMWRKDFSDAMGDGDGLTKEEMENLRNQLKSIFDRGKAEYDAMVETAGISSSSNASDQKATANMADKATYDQFELYLGIATAQQIALEQGNSVRETILASLSSLQTATDARGLVVNEIRELARTRNEYLLDIKKSNNLMLDSFNERMDNMYNLIEDRL